MAQMRLRQLGGDSGVVVVKNGILVKPELIQNYLIYVSADNKSSFLRSLSVAVGSNTRSVNYSVQRPQFDISAYYRQSDGISFSSTGQATRQRDYIMGMAININGDYTKFDIELDYSLRTINSYSAFNWMVITTHGDAVFINGNGSISGTKKLSGGIRTFANKRCIDTFTQCQLESSGTGSLPQIDDSYSIKNLILYK